MDNPLTQLLSFFPVGTAEGERHLLARAYVKNEELSEILTPPPGSPRLLIGRKGTGKTAILQYAASVFAASKVPYLSLKPLDLVLPPSGAAEPIATLTRSAFHTLLEAIAAELGRTTSGLITSEDQILYKAAIAGGLKSPDIVTRLADLLPKIAKQVTSVDLTNLFPDTKATATEVQRAISSHLRRTNGGCFLLLDDTDQVAAPTVRDHLNRIWAFLLATRELTQRIPALTVIVTLRDEVWRRLLRDEAGQRDQADHFLRLVCQLFPTRAHIRGVVDRRLFLAAQAPRTKDTDSSYAPFFEGMDARMPFSEERRSWDDLIVLRSRERPRDAVQLVNALASRAKGRGASKISEQDFHQVMPEFSKERVQLLVQEVELECPHIKEVVDSFAALPFDYGSFKITADALRGHLRQLPSIFGIQLFSRTLRPGDDDDAFALWLFLFELGILNARVADSRERDGFRHILPSFEPGLVSRARWNEMQAIVWEVNPAYRDYLISRQKDEAARTGLPPRRRPTR